MTWAEPAVAARCAPDERTVEDLRRLRRACKSVVVQIAREQKDARRPKLGRIR